VAHSGRRNADEALALALASGQTLRDAARAVGIGERTAARRWADPAFRRRVTETRSALFAEAVGRLAVLAGKAADALGELLTSGRDLVKLQAAKGVLELGPKLREAGELAERLDALERRMAGEAEDADRPGGGRRAKIQGTRPPPKGKAERVVAGPESEEETRDGVTQPYRQGA
jgi:hypothetical protein